MLFLRRYLSVMFLVLLAVKAFYSAANAGSDMMCTQMWCDEGFTLNLTAPQWQAGQYQIAMDVDGTAVTCTAQLPLPPCGQEAFTCTANDLDFAVITQGCAMPPATHALGGVRMQKVPKNFSAIVTLPDGSVRTTAGAVESHCGFPNGEHCDPRACCTGKMALSLQ